MTANGQVITSFESPKILNAYCDALNRIANTAQAQTSVATNRGSASANGPEQRTDAPQDRYASYYNRGQGASSESTVGGRSVAPQSPGTTPAPTAQLVAAAREPRQGPKEYVNEMAGQKKGPVGAQTDAPQPQQSKTPATPPTALDGFCPVTLTERHVWQPGDEKWGAIHRGRTYLFASEDAQQRFLADPDRFSPVFAGNDPVQRVEHNKIVPGKREHGAFYLDRVYLFASEDSYQRFYRDPDRYMVDTARQARRR
jgi:YHS domain-containing protein